MIDRTRYLEFDKARHTTADWDFVADRFNAKFAGKRIPGSMDRYTQKTARQLSCAWVENRGEFGERLKEAFIQFLAERERKRDESRV